MPDATATPPAAPPGPERGRSSDARQATTAIVVAALVVVLVAVVAVLAVRGRDADAATAVPQIDTPLDLLSGLIAVLVVVGVALVVALVVAGMTKVDNAAPLAFGSLAGAGLVVGVLIVIASLFDPPEAEEMEMDLAPVQEEGPAEDPTDPAPVWPFVVALALGAAAVAAIPLTRALRGDGRVGDREGESAEELAARRLLLTGLLDDALDELRRHPDPREAVITAWARLETAVEAVGGERAPSDTPLRFLDRLLRSVSASAPAVSRLTAAFEHAMFSDHPIGPTDQAEAVDALVAVRDELGATPTAGRAGTDRS